MDIAKRMRYFKFNIFYFLSLFYTFISSIYVIFPKTYSKNISFWRPEGNEDIKEIDNYA